MRRVREVQLFNFSFLDILATVIGVLLFILLMAILHQSGIADYAEWEQKLNEAQARASAAEEAEVQAKAAYEVARQETQRVRNEATGEAAAMATEAGRLADASQALADQVAAAERRAKELKDRRERLAEQVANQQAAVENEGAEYRLPKAAGGAGASPVHVDCRKEGLVILGLDVTSGVTSREVCPVDDIEKPGGAYRRLIARVKKSRSAGRPEVIVLWVRPDAVDTADKAITAAEEAKAPLGWEPADSNWAF